MKKRIFKGIVAAVFSLTAVFSISQGIPAKSGCMNALTAEAACNHNYRHYEVLSAWKEVPGTHEPGGNELDYYEEVCTGYVYCVNCGGDKSKIRYHRRRVCEWDTLSREGKIIAHHKAVVKVYY